MVAKAKLVFLTPDIQVSSQYSFAGTLDTWLCLNRWVFADRTRRDCKLRNDDCVEMSCNGGIDFLSAAFGSDRRFACMLAALSPHKHWNG